MPSPRPLASSSANSGDLISPQSLFRMMATSSIPKRHLGMTIIDIRSRSNFRRQHIPGSQSIPSGWLISGELPDGDLILVGDSTPHTSGVIDQLHAQGYPRRILHLAGGFRAWREQDLPLSGQARHSHPIQGKQRLRLILAGLPLSPWKRSRSHAGA